MHFGLHDPGGEKTETVERVKNELAPHWGVDCKKRKAMAIVQFALDNEIDPQPFSRATGVSPETLQTGDRHPAYPRELLDTDHVRQLQAFATEMLQKIHQQYDIEALRDRLDKAPRGKTAPDVFDPNEYRAYVSWARLELLADLTRAAAAHDLEMYYGEGDVDS